MPYQRLQQCSDLKALMFEYVQISKTSEDYLISAIKVRHPSSCRSHAGTM